jgi:hypothetical protein
VRVVAHSRRLRLRRELAIDIRFYSPAIPEMK